MIDRTIEFREQEHGYASRGETSRWQELARAEALAILAETEPVTFEVGCACHQQGSQQAAEALADALAAFITEEEEV